MGAWTHWHLSPLFGLKLSLPCWQSYFNHTHCSTYSVWVYNNLKEHSERLEVVKCNCGSFSTSPFVAHWNLELEAWLLTTSLLAPISDAFPYGEPYLKVCLSPESWSRPVSVRNEATYAEFSWIHVKPGENGMLNFVSLQGEKWPKCEGDFSCLKVLF